MADPAMTQAAGIRRDEIEVVIDAPVARVWEAMTRETHEWFRKDYFAAEDTKRMVLEPRVGGRLYEDSGDGNGLLWYIVNMIVPQKSLDLSGFVATRYGGPALSLLYIQLEEKQGKTTVKVSDSRVGSVEECGTANGWRIVFGDGLKSYVEGK